MMVMLERELKLQLCNKIINVIQNFMVLNVFH